MKTARSCLSLMAFATIAAPAGGEPPMAVDPQTGEVAPMREVPPARVTRMASDKPEVPVPAVRPMPEALEREGGVYDLGPLGAEAIAAADAEALAKWGHVKPGPQRTSVVRRMEPTPLILLDDAVRTALGEDREVLTSAIRSPGALGLRVHMTEFDVGNASVLFYCDGPDGPMVHGPFKGKGPNRDGEFWSPHTPGDVVFVEVRGMPTGRVTIDAVLHFDRDPGQPTAGDRAVGELPCHLDVMCFGDPPVNAVARDATGHMDFVSGGLGGNCTGTLLNDLDDTTFTPYFLTAFHCLNTQAEVDTLEVTWFWQRDSCGGTLPSFSTLPFNLGGTLLETNPTDGGNDMTFIRLAGEAPNGTGQAGWTTGHPSDAVGIHHPRGSWKRVTFSESEGACPGCEFCGDGTDYDYYIINTPDGITEEGSSGSGLFNDSGQLSGQLFGRCCVVPACADEVFDCAEADEWDAQYGEFETTFPIVQRWLEMGGTIRVNAANTTLPWLGTPNDPFRTVNEANNISWDGAIMRIQSASYDETLTITNAMTVLADGGVVTVGE